MTKGTKIALGIGISAVIIGSIIYFSLKAKKKKTGEGKKSKTGEMGASGYILAVSDLSGRDTFAIYPYIAPAKTVAKWGTDIIVGNEREPAISEDFLSSKDFGVGDKIKITGNGDLNGQYEIDKVWYSDKDQTRLVAITLKNNSKWDGTQPKNSSLRPNAKTAKWYWTKEAQIPTFTKV